MLSLLRQPDAAYGATEKSDFRFEEKGVCDVKFEYVVQKNSAKVIIYPSDSPIKYLKLRFRGDLTDVDKVFGDQWERAGSGAYLEWRSVMPSRALPWYCYLKTSNQTFCYGVKTGADCLAFFNVDTSGITLFLNLCCGNDGVDISAPFTVCEVVEHFGDKGEDCYKAACDFAKKCCDSPRLPKEPIFGLNDWYWAYGNISHDTVMQETDLVVRLASGCVHKPYKIIDDGWQLNRENAPSATCIGGPWVPNSRFKDMKQTVRLIHEKGAKAGVWFRPLLTTEAVPEEAILRKDCGGTILDPSHPFTLETVERDARKMREWGFDLIKFDFTTSDATGRAPLSADDDGANFRICIDGVKFYDKTKTTATILKNLYKAVQKGAGEAEVIGCQTISHLTAGINSAYRLGNDTSGISFEWTKRHGLNSFMRMPLNGAFYNGDPDCAAFTSQVDFSANLSFLELCARSKMTTLASVKPNSLTDDQAEKINSVFKIADQAKGELTVKNYDKTAFPELFVTDSGNEIKYDWNGVYDGSRVVLDWDK